MAMASQPVPVTMERRWGRMGEWAAAMNAAQLKAMQAAIEQQLNFATGADVWRLGEEWTDITCVMFDMGNVFALSLSDRDAICCGREFCDDAAMARHTLYHARFRENGAYHVPPGVPDCVARTVRKRPRKMDPAPQDAPEHGAHNATAMVRAALD